MTPGNESTARTAMPIAIIGASCLTAGAETPEIMIDLAGEPVRLRFTQVHLDDVRAIAGIASSS